MSNQRRPVDSSIIELKRSKLNTRQYAAARNRAFTQLKLIKYNLDLLATAFTSSNSAQVEDNKLYNYFANFNTVFEASIKSLVVLFGLLLEYTDDGGPVEHVDATLHKFDTVFVSGSVHEFRDLLLQFHKLESVLFKLLAGGPGTPGYDAFPSNGISSVPALEKSFREFGINTRFAAMLRTMCNDVWYPLTQASDVLDSHKVLAGQCLVAAENTFGIPLDTVSDQVSGVQKSMIESNVNSNSQYVLGHCKCDDGVLYKDNNRILYSCTCDDTACENNYYITLQPGDGFQGGPTRGVPKTFHLDLMHHDVRQFVHISKKMTNSQP